MKKIYTICLFMAVATLFAQTETDGIMMEKKQFCAGATYQYSSFNQYWEGTFLRENLNMGTISKSSIGLMGNYGITNKWNVIFNIPYVKTNASAGTLLPQKGFQDFSMSIKYLAFDKSYKNWDYSAYLVGGFSVPMTNYVADYLPLNIGLHSNTATIRLMGDIQKGSFYTTFSGAYIRRGNITIDRNAYFTNEYHYTNKVYMPDMANFNFRLGYRTKRLIADVYFDKIITKRVNHENFDITQNNMPFPSNTMNSTKTGVYAKYTFKKINGLSLIGDYNYVLEGRNVGQSKTITGGVFYVMNFKK